MKISLVINADSRPEKNTADSIFNGAVNLDFLTDGVFNKITFLKGFDFETILFVDVHNQIPERELNYIREICDCVVLRKHTSENNFNDYNYVSALSLARGEIIMHVDQDTACFTSGKEYVDELIAHLDNYKFVSYPSHWSPDAVADPSFGGFKWASTRFFFCRKESLKLDEIRKCIEEPNYGYEKYGDRPRRCNWTEHFLTLVNDNSCYYPPIELNKGAIFSWASYEKYTLRRLNELPYNEVVGYINERGGIQYPVDVAG
ncbi:MAG TPA: hypothetical protein PKV73_01190 [Agriterribacter sp.]|nr:hypothetical protein [Agriterribacter sp.]